MSFTLDTIKKEIYKHCLDNFSEAEFVFSGSKKGDVLLNGIDPWIYAYISWGDEIDHKKCKYSYGEHLTLIGILAMKLFIRKKDSEEKLEHFTTKLIDSISEKQIDKIDLESMHIDHTGESNLWYVRFLSTSFKVVNSYSIIKNSTLSVAKNNMANFSLTCNECDNWNQIPVKKIIEKFGGNIKISNIIEKFKCSKCQSKNVNFMLVGPPN